MADICKCNYCGEILIEEEGSVESCHCEGGSEHLMDLLGSNVSINELSDDNDLIEWCSDNSYYDLPVVEINEESHQVWVKNCPYGISWEDIRN